MTLNFFDIEGIGKSKKESLSTTSEFFSNVCDFYPFSPQKYEQVIEQICCLLDRPLLAFLSCCSDDFFRLLQDFRSIRFDPTFQKLLRVGSRSISLRSATNRLHQQSNRR